MGDRLAACDVFKGGRVERLGLGGGLCAWRGEEVGEGDEDSIIVV